MGLCKKEAKAPCVGIALGVLEQELSVRKVLVSGAHSFSRTSLSTYFMLYYLCGDNSKATTPEKRMRTGGTHCDRFRCGHRSFWSRGRAVWLSWVTEKGV